MWSLGAIATPAFKKFTQDVDSSGLDRETSGFNGIFDTFYSRPIKHGVGESSVDFVADSHHSQVKFHFILFFWPAKYDVEFQVSLAVRLVPSPDWFVGLDTFDLCENGSWANLITLPLEPLDAGVDRGYTFTSPNWASRPQQKIFRITSTFPNHRASSFLYPNLSQLPTIATVTFQLLADYKLHQRHGQVSHDLEEDEELSVAKDLELELKKEFLEEVQILHGEPVQPSSKKTPVEQPEEFQSSSRLPKDLSNEDDDDDVVEPNNAKTSPKPQHNGIKSQRLIHMGV